MRKLLIVFAAWTVVAAACARQQADPTTTTSSSTTSSSTTTTTQATTTTTVFSVELGEAPPRLERLVTSVYAYATGEGGRPDRVPAPLLPEPDPDRRLRPLEGKAAVTTYRGVRVAVVQVGKDVLGAVDNGSGWRIVAGRLPSLGVRGWYGGAPHLVAVVGSDARPGRDPTQALADSLHIIGLDGKGGAGLVGIPRDSWVTIPDRGRSKINAALATGGPDRMMATLEDLSGLDLDGYVLTGFEGFTAMVGDVLGGFEMDVPQAFTDRSAKASFTAGPQHIDGSEALAFARSRKAWIDGDFRRQLHGGLVMIAALAQTKSRGPTAIPRLMAGMEPWLVTDLPPARLLTLALAANAVDPMRITNVVLRGGTSTTSGGASIVVLDEARAAEVFSDLADGSLEG